MTVLSEVAGRWAGVMSRVPRERFIPDIIYRHQRGRHGNDLVPVNRHGDPAGWRALVDTDASVITQVDDGHPAADGTGWEATSSSSQPAVMVDMLTQLDPQPGERVLEIGTGTGWNAALLAEVVGAGNVTTVELDPAVAAHAAARLKAAGYGAVATVVGDGSEFTGQFDHIIATVGTGTIPYTWIASCVPGGRIVVPLNNRYQPPGVTVLTNHPDGTATGRLSGPAAFMGIRSTRTARGPADSHNSPAEHHTTTDRHPWHLVGNRDAAVAIGQHVSGISWSWSDTTLWLYGIDGSWASLHLTEAGPNEVEQAGPRQLFDEVEQAYLWWADEGEPGVGDWLVTVTPGGQSIALSPEG